MIEFDANCKRTNGQYFTQNNPFKNCAFMEWSKTCDFRNQIILEPFAGANNLIKMLKNMKLCKGFVSYDIEPKSKNVLYKDTLLDFPKGYNICITNPPYLAKNSATRRRLNYPNTNYDDLYKYALSKCLENCENVGAIIPASFLNSSLFRHRLSHYILLSSKMFNDTEHPVCLALFKNTSKEIKIYDGESYIGLLSELERKLPKNNDCSEIKFNDRNGKLGLIAIDNTIEPSIKFIRGEEIPPDKIEFTSRSITRITIKERNINGLIKKLNSNLNKFRDETADIFLTPFKGIRKDGKFRRRLDFSMARSLIGGVA
ncbi:MAG: hypothetical protein LBC85_09545 [Fibromonadaceae bacterium]|jgi:hypothetical protein|nr:hypothetical protein [Fibromonadaceae bacterium]